MKTNIISAFLIMALTISMLPAVMAAEEVTTTIPEDPTIQEEVQIMNTATGAEIRLLQLENTIQIHIEIGNKVIEKAQELGKNTTELEAILAEMQDLQTQVQETDPTAEDAVEQYITLRENARELTQEFRETAQTLFTDEELQQLREEQEAIKEQAKNNERIREKIREFNAQQLQKMKQMGLDTEDIAQKLANGEITTEQAREMIKERVKQMTPEQRAEVYNKVKEQKIEIKIRAREDVQKAMENYSERYQKMLEKRLNNSTIGTSNEVKEMIQQRIREQMENMTGNQTQERAQEQAQEMINETMNIIGGH